MPLYHTGKVVNTTMMYLDPWFWNMTAKPCEYFTSARAIPNGCDVAGLVFYNFDNDAIRQEINRVCELSDRVLVVINEPVFDLRPLLASTDKDKTLFFADVVPTYKDPRLFTDISWFIVPENYYKEKVWARDLMLQLDFGYDKPKKFDCLLGSQRPHRDYLQTLYENSPYKDSVIFNYYKKSPHNGIWDYDIENSHNSSHMISYRGFHVRTSSVLPISIYNQSYYSIVAETTTFCYQSQFTEKVAKPMLARRPFVAFCGHHYLRNLKSLGFRTFDPVIDESYDEVEDDAQRFDMAWRQVEELCRHNPESVLGNLEQVLDHNRSHFLSTDWHANVKRFLDS